MNTWRRKHRPVLRAVVSLFDEQGFGPVTVANISQHTDLEAGDVQKILNALNQTTPGYFTGIEEQLSGIDGVNAPTDTARRALGWRQPGAWPNMARRAVFISSASLVVSTITLIVAGILRN
jgi:hypothetical protein